MTGKSLKRTNEVLTGGILGISGEEIAPGQSHYHIAFCNYDLAVPVAILAPADDGHTHKVEWYAPPPEQPGMPPQQPSFRVLPGEDGHTHDFEEYVLEIKEKKEKADDVVKDVHALFKTACAIEADSRKDAEEAERFYMGEHWDKQVKHKLESLDRAALTINMIEKESDELEGHQRQSRRDPRYVPRGDGDQRTADLYNIIAKQILNESSYGAAESDVFLDQILAGRGNFHVYVDFERDIQGEIKIESFPSEDIAYGPHEKKDGSDCEYLVKHKMYSLQKGKQLWRSKAKELEDQFQNASKDPDLFKDDGADHVQYQNDQYGRSDSWKPVKTLAGHKVLDIARKEIRVFECQRVIYRESWVAAHPQLGFYHNLFGWKDADREKISRIPGFFVAEKPIRKIRISRVAGNVLLSDENPCDLPVDEFNVVPVYAKKRRNRFWGKVKRAIDPQKELNKRASQSIDIGNKCAAYGWFIDGQTFPNQEAKEQFKGQATQPGFIQEINSVQNPPMQVEGVKFPREIVELMEMSKGHLKELIAIAPDRTGANESGLSLMHRQRQQLVGSEYLFDNLSQAKRRLMLMLLGYIQRYYPPQRCMRILKNANSKDPFQVGGSDFGAFTEDEIKGLLKDIEISKYDVEVAEISSSPTVKLQNFMIMSELQRMGMPIPPDLMIELSDIPAETKSKIQQALAAQAAAAQQAQSEASGAEIDKTLAAKGVITPQVQQRIQGGAPQGSPGAQPPAAS